MMQLREDPRLIWRENVSQALGGAINPFGQGVDPFRMNRIRQELLIYWRFPPDKDDKGATQAMEKDGLLDNLRLEVMLDKHELAALKRQSQQDGWEDEAETDWMAFGTPLG